MNDPSSKFSGSDDSDDVKETLTSLGDPSDGEDEEAEDEDEDEDSGEEDEDDETEDDPAPAPRRRKRGPVAVKKKGTTPTKTWDEIPRDLVLELQARGVDQISLEVRRQLPTGQWANIRGGIKCPLFALFELQHPVTLLAGGGTFVFTVSDPISRAQILPRWREQYDGQPKVPPSELTLAYNQETGHIELFSRDGSTSSSTVYAGNPSAQGWGLPGVTPPSVQQQLVAPLPAQLDPQNPLYQQALMIGPSPQFQAGRLLPPPSGLLPPWLQTYSPDVQWKHVLEERMRGLETKQQQQGGDGDGMMGQWVATEMRRGGDLQAEVTGLRTQLALIESRHAEKLEHEKAAYTARLEAERELRLKAERDAERKESDARYDALLAKIDAQANAKPAFDMQALVGLAGVLGPVWSSKMTADAERAKADRDAEMKLTLAQLGKKENGTAEMLALLGPIAVPLLVKWLEGKSPQAHAELLGIEHEQRMMHLKMMADMLASITPEPPPAWQPIVEGALKMFGSSMMPRMLPPPQQQQQQQGPRQIPAPVGGPSPFEQQLERFAELDVDAAADVRSIYDRLPAELGFHTHEWMTIMFNVHSRLLPSELVPIINDHIVGCTRFGLLPSPLERVFEDPENAFRTVFMPLPIHDRDPEYVEQLIGMLVADIHERGLGEEDDGEDDEDPDENVNVDGVAVIAGAGAVINNGLVRKTG